MEYFFEPNEFFVGDHVSFYFCLPEDFTYKDFSIEKIKQNTSLIINNISTTQINEKTFIKLDFVPWEVGKISFPLLNEVGLNFEFPSIYVSSILELDKNLSLQEVRPPLLLPGTTYLIYAYVFSFFIVFISLSTFIIWIRKKRTSIINKFSQKYAIFIFNLEIKKLKTKLKKRNIEVRKSWIKRYETSFRLFLSSMYKNTNNWNSFTYNEILEAIKEPNAEVLNLIKSIFDDVSIIRFANISDSKIENKIIDISFQLLKLYRGKI